MRGVVIEYYQFGCGRRVFWSEVCSITIRIGNADIKRKVRSALTNVDDVLPRHAAACNVLQLQSRWRSFTICRYYKCHLSMASAYKYPIPVFRHTAYY